MEEWRNGRKEGGRQTEFGRMQSPMTFMRLFDSLIASAADDYTDAIRAAAISPRHD